MGGRGLVKLRINIKIKYKLIWHSALLALLSSGGQDQGWNEQSNEVFVVWTKKLMQAGGGSQ